MEADAIKKVPPVTLMKDADRVKTYHQTVIRREELTLCRRYLHCFLIGITLY